MIGHHSHPLQSGDMPMIGRSIELVEMAREACAGMTEAQRLAFAIELVNGAQQRGGRHRMELVSQSAGATSTCLSQSSGLGYRGGKTLVAAAVQAQEVMIADERHR
jgi:hypothetical protein